VNKFTKRWASPFADAPFQTPKVCLPHVALHHSTNPWRIPVSTSHQIEILSPPWVLSKDVSWSSPFFHFARSFAIFDLHVASLILCAVIGFFQPVFASTEPHSATIKESLFS
jgi:hypothetical protein